jgi:riboflavin kinase/FMN adenylyltransferase
VEVLIVLAFDRALSEKSAEAFVEDVLVTGMAVTHIAVGSDFVFGHDRLGTVDRLTELGGRLGFAVTSLAPVAGSDGTVYSSTAIRKALKAGEPRRAAALLGRPWEIEGRVEHGDARGRRLGFPTANISLGDYLRPAYGVYAVEAGIDHGAATEWHRGVANLGRRPTVAGLIERLEAHLFDFDGDLYGRHLRVRLIEFIRPEKKFDGLDALQAQIARDSATARAILAG